MRWRKTPYERDMDALDATHASGGLSDEDYEAAKRQTLLLHTILNAKKRERGGLIARACAGDALAVMKLTVASLFALLGLTLIVGAAVEGI